MKNFIEAIYSEAKNFDEGMLFGKPDNIKIIYVSNPVVKFFKEKGKVKVNFEERCDLQFSLKDTKKEYYSSIEKNFSSDGASIPKFFRSYLSPWEIVFSAFFHDSFYHGNEIFTEDPNNKWHACSGVAYDRADADNLFLAIMKHNKISKLKRLGAYGAVRLRGEKYWRKRKWQKQKI